MTAARSPSHPIQPIFLQRWSPRAFDASHMPEADLLCMLEAARWAPSAFNVQPWRFLYALRDDSYWSGYLDTLSPFNRNWADQASALIAVVSNTIKPKTLTPFRSHSFDTGAAWAHIALQATALGYHAHAMAGIDFDLARKTLQVPDDYCIEIIIAIGKKGDPAQLPEDLRQREQPNDRKALREIAHTGTFPS